MTNPSLYGTECRIGYTFDPADPADPLPEVGFFLLTSGGSAYEVMEVVRIRGRDDKVNVVCLRTDPAKLAENVLSDTPQRVIQMHWMPRSKRKGNSRR